MRLTLSTRQSRTSGPTPLPVCLRLLLGSHAQKLGCFALALGSRGWHLPLTVPGFCLPEGSPARESTRKSQPPGWVCPISQICPQDGHREHSVPTPQMPPGPPKVTIISPKPFPPKKETEDKRALVRGVKSTFLLWQLIRLFFCHMHVRVHMQTSAEKSRSDPCPAPEPRGSCPRSLHASDLS